MTKSIDSYISGKGIPLTPETQKRLSSFSSIDDIIELNNNIYVVRKCDDTYTILTIKPDGSSSFGIYIQIAS